MTYNMYTGTHKKKIGFASLKLSKSRTPPSKYVILNISASRALRNLPFNMQMLWGGDYSQTDFRTFSSVTSAVIGENVRTFLPIFQVHLQMCLNSSELLASCVVLGFWSLYFFGCCLVNSYGGLIK